MKKADKKFIDEKLDLVLRDSGEPVPESLRARYAELADGLPQPKAKSPRTRLLAALVPCAAAVVLAVVLCFVFLPKKDTPYYNYVLEEQIVSLEEILPYNFLLPDNSYMRSNLALKKDIHSKETISAELQFIYVFGKLNIVVIMVDDYTYEATADFEELPQTGSTEKFFYRYHIFNGRQALAKFEYKAYTYYITYTSDTPEDLPLLLQSFSEPA